ncbi:hypothetical protein RRF57_009106 [Xylaria bambusicola]|uniref:Uncharacterized protein n=1 Tax=Xylaria bambusicola TaxID=326684 RepID=A0AAN7Z7L4_9PEZI
MTAVEHNCYDEFLLDHLLEQVGNFYVSDVAPSVAGDVSWHESFIETIIALQVAKNCACAYPMTRVVQVDQIFRFGVLGHSLKHVDDVFVRRPPGWILYGNPTIVVRCRGRKLMDVGVLYPERLSEVFADLTNILDTALQVRERYSRPRSTADVVVYSN